MGLSYSSIMISENSFFTDNYADIRQGDVVYAINSNGYISILDSSFAS